MHRAALALASILALSAVAAADETGIIKTNPVTGRPTFDIVSEEEEIADARRIWSTLRDEAEARGYPVDPAGDRFDRIRGVFERLVRVAHRQNLPWQVHLIDVPVVNAATPGGGVVFVFSGLFELTGSENEHALAAVLAHEIAHVTLLHAHEQATHIGLGSLLNKEVDDPFYKAAFTTEQEAAADRVGALYMALAGFNAMAAPVMWERAQEKFGGSAASSGFLHDHPVNAERVAITRDAAAKASEYRIPGEQNPDWARILESNTIVAKVSLPEEGPGAGTARAFGALADAYFKHSAARSEQRDRERAAQTLRALQVSRPVLGQTTDGRPGLFVRIHNPGPRAVTGLAFAVDYLQGQQVVGTDSTCAGMTAIRPGQTVQLGCPLTTSGAANWSMRIVNVTID